MAEVQKTVLSGALAQKFIEFVMLQSQQASFFLGRIPHPQTGQPVVNLPSAKILIDQLAMIREKTRGNLTAEEIEIIESVLEDLQAAYAQATGPAVA